MHYKKTLFATIILISSFAVHAQEFRFGIKGGLNKTFFTVNQQFLGSYSTSETGFYGGLFLEFPIDSALSIQPETLYISVGDFNFLNVPIYAKYEVARRLYLMAGPSVNYFFDFFNNSLFPNGAINKKYKQS